MCWIDQPFIPIDLQSILPARWIFLSRHFLQLCPHSTSVLSISWLRSLSTYPVKPVTACQASGLRAATLAPAVDCLHTEVRVEMEEKSFRCNIQPCFSVVDRSFTMQKTDWIIYINGCIATLSVSQSRTWCLVYFKWHFMVYSMWPLLLLSERTLCLLETFRFRHHLSTSYIHSMPAWGFRVIWIVDFSCGFALIWIRVWRSEPNAPQPKKPLLICFSTSCLPNPFHQESILLSLCCLRLMRP